MSFPRRRSWMVALLTLAFGVLSSVPGASAASPQDPAQDAKAQEVRRTTPTPEEQQAVKTIVTTFYQLREKRDVAAFADLWHPLAPRRPRSAFPANFVFPYYSLQAGPLTLSKLTLKWSTLSVRVSVPVTEAVGRREVTLPLFPTESPEQVQAVVDAVLSALDAADA